MTSRWITILLSLVAVASAFWTFGFYGIVLTAVLMVVAYRARNAKLFGAMATDAVLLLFAGLLFIGVPWLFVQLVRSKDPERFNREFCRDHLHQIMQALHEYNQDYGVFPPAYVADKNGRPMHSWRVLILPYLKADVRSLYKRYDFNEPWDGPNNRKLLTARPSVYACSSDKSPDHAVCTNYVAVVGLDAAWSGHKPNSAADIAPMARTVMLVESCNADVPWTEPRDLGDYPDLPADGGKLARRSTSPQAVAISSNHLPSGYFFHIPQAKVHVEMADGNVPLVPEEIFDAPDSASLLKIGGFPEEYLDKEWKPSVGRIHWPNCISFAVWSLSVGLLLWQAAQFRKQLALASSAEQFSEFRLPRNKKEEDKA
jgi:hypothetical protein